MNLMGQWAPPQYADLSTSGEGIGDALGWFPFPMVEGGAGGPDDAIGGGNGFVIGKDAPDEAVEFLKYISSVDSQVDQAIVGMSLPVVKGAEMGIQDDMLKLVAEGTAKAKYFQLYYDQAMTAAVGSVVNDSVQGIFAGTLTPEECAQAIEDAAVLEYD